jgi:hypothetical protein
MFSLLAVLVLAAGDTTLPRLRALSARADSLLAAADRSAALAHREVEQARRAQLVHTGQLTGIFWSSVPRASAEGIMMRADSTIREFGGIPQEFESHSIVLQMWTTASDSIRGTERASGHSVDLLDWVGRPDTLEASDNAALGIARSYLATLDPIWQRYLSGDYGTVWRRGREAEWVLRALAESQHASGQGCIAGNAAACRRWLGLDAVAQPFRERYTPADIRRIARGNHYRSDSDWQRCDQGDDAACYRFVESNEVIDPIPAGSEMRASLVRALRALHGGPALQAALRDTTGSVGERFARAAGLSEDAFVLEWRAWVLSRGRPERVTAGAGDAGAVLATVAAVLALAMRRGR